MDEGRAAQLVSNAIRTCRRRRRSPKIMDSTGVTLSGGEVLARAFILRRILRRGVLPSETVRVGVLLPPSAGALVTNLALTFDRRVVVNLNYSLNADLINRCIAQAGITHVLTSKRFLER